MKKIFQRIDRLRAFGSAVLDLQPGMAYYHLTGKRFLVQSIGTPGLKCRVTLLIKKNKPVDFTIHDVM